MDGRRISIPVGAGIDRLQFHVSRLFPEAFHPDDARVLAVRLRGLRLHQDAERHTFVSRQHLNAVLNLGEVLAARTMLQSTPPSLGIDLHGVCNVKPPCVYCEWDFSKALEGDNVDMPFTRDTLERVGRLLRNAVDLVNCSIGEPFMMRNFDELLDIFGNTGKVLEMTTNGQILTERNMQKLVDRNVDLYISLDAATPLTYSRLRNDTFDKLLDEPSAARRRQRRPRPLAASCTSCSCRCAATCTSSTSSCGWCAELGVDRMVLRPLNYSPSSVLDWERGGPSLRLPGGAAAVRRAGARQRPGGARCRELGVELSDQMDFGGAMRELFEEEFARGEGLGEPAAPLAHPGEVRHATPPLSMLPPAAEASVAEAPAIRRRR